MEKKILLESKNIGTLRMFEESNFHYKNFVSYTKEEIYER